MVTAQNLRAAHGIWHFHDVDKIKSSLQHMACKTLDTFYCIVNDYNSIYQEELKTFETSIVQVMPVEESTKGKSLPAYLFP
jgi:hypothetical protein